MQNQNDPYTPPPRYKDRSGVLLRVAILAVLMLGAVAGYSYVSNNMPAGGLTPTQEFAESAVPVVHDDFVDPTAPIPSTPDTATAPPTEQPEENAL